MHRNIPSKHRANLPKTAHATSSHPLRFFCTDCGKMYSYGQRENPVVCSNCDSLNIIVKEVETQYIVKSNGVSPERFTEAHRFSGFVHSTRSDRWG